MKSQNTISSFKRVLPLMFFVLFVANTFSLADTKEISAVERLGKDEAFSIATKGLSKKLQNDLVLNDVAVKFSKTETYAVSGTQFGLRGEGTCLLDGKANDLPIAFDVKIDVSKRAALDVKYVFLNMDGAKDASAALTAEDVVTEKLLERIKNDFKTQNIVVAIEYLNDQTFQNGEKGFAGGGEIRVNGMEWKKIAFDVKGDKTNASIISYKMR